MFIKNKSHWEIEIEQTFERLKKIEDDLHIKEKLLEAREKRLRELEMEYITASSKLIVSFDSFEFCFVLPRTFFFQKIIEFNAFLNDEVAKLND